MPLNIEHYYDDTACLTDKQARLYMDAICLYWRRGGDITLDALAIGCKANRKAINDLITAVPGMAERDGRLFHQHYSDEYVRATKASEGASAAAQARWGGRKR